MASSKGYHLLVVTSALLWGSSFPIVKVTLDFVNPYFLTSVRMLIAAAVAVVFVSRFSGLEVFKDRTIWVLAGLNSLGYTLQHIGMQFALASESSLLINVNVVFVAILAAYFLGEKLTVHKGLALTLGVAGIMILTTKGDVSYFASEELWGQLIILTAGMVWAIYIVLAKKSLATHGVLDLSMVVIIETAVIISPLLVINTPTGIALEGWLGLLYLGTVCTVLALTIYIMGLREVGATVSSILLIGEVLFAIVLSVLFLSEEITAALIIGGTLILVAIVLASLSGEEPTQR